MLIRDVLRRFNPGIGQMLEHPMFSHPLGDVVLDDQAVNRIMVVAAFQRRQQLLPVNWS